MKPTTNTWLKMWVPLMLVCLVGCVRSSTTRWWPTDNYDTIDEKMAAVNSLNCASKSNQELQLETEALAWLPRDTGYYGGFSDTNKMKNLWYIYTLALARSHALSYMLAKFSSLGDFQYQPGLMHYYMSAVADLTSSGADDDVTTNHRLVTGSGVFFDANKCYANWYRNLRFNNTLNGFGPRAWSGGVGATGDNGVFVTDYGADPDKRYTTMIMDNYSPVPDDRRGTIWRKQAYDILSKNSTQSDYSSFRLFTSTFPAEASFRPIRFKRPFFDCGRSNKWIVTAVSPAMDFLPRYTVWMYLRSHRFVAQAAVDMPFAVLDINTCPPSAQDPGPNMYGGLAKCKQNTTMCQPVSGLGFRRGGYRCECLPGYYYPPGQEGPFEGVAIEQASQDEYQKGFDCVTAEQYTALVAASVSGGSGQRKRREAPGTDGQFTEESYQRVNEIFRQKASVNAENCRSKTPEELRLSRDVSYGADEHFSHQALAVDRLAHFLSAFLQTLRTAAVLPLLKVDRPFHAQQLYAELIGIVMADKTILATGIYFDRDLYRDPEGHPQSLFAAYAFRRAVYDAEDGAAEFADDNIRLLNRTQADPVYVDQAWFQQLKDQWGSDSLANLPVFTLTPRIRTDLAGSGIEDMPLDSDFNAAATGKGSWSEPHFPCEDLHQNWVITYAAPFFGKNTEGTGAKFYGAVTVEVPLNLLDIDPCTKSSSSSSSPNVFSGSAPCHPITTRCAQRGHGFRRGTFECECLPGHAYPADNHTAYLGPDVLQAYMEYTDGINEHNYRNMTCRRLVEENIVDESDDTSGSETVWASLSLSLAVLFVMALI